MKFILNFLIFTSILHAQLAFENNDATVKPPPDVTLLPYDFHFENKGTKTMKISKCEPSCSCISVQIGNDGKMEYAPGEKGTIRATFDMNNFSGKVDKVILLWLEGDEASKPSHRLTLHVEIPVIVSMEPKTLEWKAGEKLDPKTIKIKMDHTEPIHILSANSSNKLYTTELKTITDGKEYDLIVSPVADTKVPHSVAVIHIDTDCKIEKQKKQMAFAVVRTTGATLGAPPMKAIAPPQK